MDKEQIRYFSEAKTAEMLQVGLTEKDIKRIWFVQNWFLPIIGIANIILLIAILLK